ncbi:MAG: hypothetical protein ABI051_01030 [Vicinamibacterales bacterium]
MTLVTTVTGRRTAVVGDVVTYRATGFSPATPSRADMAAVGWLVKAEDGAALASMANCGPEFEVTIPMSWAGHDVLVMPFLRAPSAAIAVTTSVAPVTAPAPIATGEAAPLEVRIEKDLRRYYASVGDEPRFFLGADVVYGARRGLMNSANPPGPRYAAEDFEGAHGDWAWYLQPTITCESNRSFACLNTYDTAAFTFGHAQFAAHTPDDNFVLVFREALGQPEASSYFPDLTVTRGRIHLVTETGMKPLESATSTRPLMSYLNPSPDSIDREETDRAARLVHWCVSHAALRELLVAFFVRQQRAKLNTHARKLPLEGLTDKLCLTVLDILHQGRAKYAAIQAALEKADPFDALLALGASTYKERVGTLRQEIQKLEARGLVGTKVFSTAAKDFVVPAGA